MRIKRFRFPAALCLAGSTIILVASGAPKIEIAELISKHLEAIGSADARSARQSTAASAMVRVDFLVGGSGHLEGPALYSSQDLGDMLFLEFNQANYQREHFICNGDDVQIGFMQPGMRSPLGDFLFTYKYVLSDGLLGGVLSSRWPLLDPDFGGSKLKYDGLKKVDGQPLHRVDYRSKKGRDVEVKLYFDPETYRHVRSEYEVTISPPMGPTPSASSQQRRTRITVTESFSQFEEVDGITLPTAWEIHFSRTGNVDSTIWKWTISFNKVRQNETVEEKYFNLRLQGGD